MGENLNKLRKEPQEEKDQMYEISHQGLTDTRKKYDDMKKQRIKIDDQIYRLKVLPASLRRKSRNTPSSKRNTWTRSRPAARRSKPAPKPSRTRRLCSKPPPTRRKYWRACATASRLTRWCMTRGSSTWRKNTRSKTSS